MARHDLIGDAINLLGKEAVEAIQQTGRASKWNKSRINQEIRNAMKGAAGDAAIESVIPFKPDASGQWTIKGAEPNPIVSQAAQTASNGSPIPSSDTPGQVSMFDNSGSVFQDSTGQYHTPASKRREIKEARAARRDAVFNQNLAEGPDGQIYMSSVDTMQGPPRPKQGPMDKPDIIPNGQISFVPNSSGGLTTSNVIEEQKEAAARAARQVQIDIDNRMGIKSENERKFDTFKRKKNMQAALEADDARKAEISQEVNKNLEIKNREDAYVDAYNAKYRTPTQAEHDALQAEYDAMGKRMDELDKANRGFRRRTLDGVKDGATGMWNTVSGKNRAQVTANRRAYNQQVANSGKGAYITSNAEYKRMQRTYAASGADTPESLYENMMKAQENATNGLNWSGISEWAHDNQLLAAGAIAGGAILVSEILNDDDY
jgi:hypothetical protein